MSSQEEKKFQSLVKLLDDPEEEVLRVVKDQIIGIGPKMIPYLEKSWELSPDTETLETIEELIQILKMQNLAILIDQWKNDPDAGILEGVWLVARIQYPELELDDLRKLIQPIRDEIWLELHNQLTALEKIKVVNHFFYEKFKFNLNLKQPELPGNHFINQVIESKAGNPVSITLLYVVLCQELGLPVFGISFPAGNLLVYQDLPILLPLTEVPEEVTALFYINPANNGTVLGHRDIMYYLIQNKLAAKEEFFHACGYETLIKRQLKRLCADYLSIGNKSRAKQVEGILKLWD